MDTPLSSNEPPPHHGPAERPRPLAVSDLRGLIEAARRSRQRGAGRPGRFVLPHGDSTRAGADHAAAVDAVRLELDLTRDFDRAFVAGWGLFEVCTRRTTSPSTCGDPTSAAAWMIAPLRTFSRARRGRTSRSPSATGSRPPRSSPRSPHCSRFCIKGPSVSAGALGNRSSSGIAGSGSSTTLAGSSSPRSSCC